MLRRETVIFGIVVALAGGIGGGVVGYRGSEQFGSGRSRGDFVRGQRQVAYSNLLADMDAWLKATDGYAADLSPDEAITLATADQTSLQKASARYTMDETTITVIGSDRAVFAAAQFDSAETQVNLDLERVDVSPGNFPTTHLTGPEARYAKDRRTAYADQSGFLSIARKDVGA